MQYKASTKPALSLVLFRGAYKNCPQCGQGRALHSYLKAQPEFTECGEIFSHICADESKYHQYAKVFVSI